MTEPRQPNGQQPGDPAEAAPSLEALGEQLLREAREGQADYSAGWREFMGQLGIEGKPVGARQLRDMLLREGTHPETNEFSRGIIALREESA